MERTTEFKDGVDMNVSEQLSITFLPNEDTTSSSYNTLRLNFTQMGEENFSISMTPCEALDIISALGIAVQFYLHNQTQYKNDVVRYLMDNKKTKRDESFHIKRDELGDINENKRIKSYENIYTVISELSNEDRDIMVILSDILDSIDRIKPEIFYPESYYLSFFDIFGIYDKDIEILYKGICKEKAVNVLILLVSMCMKVTPYKEVLESIANKTEVDVDFDNLIKLIQKELPLFTVLDVE